MEWARDGKWNISSINWNRNSLTLMLILGSSLNLWQDLYHIETESEFKTVKKVPTYENLSRSYLFTLWISSGKHSFRIWCAVRGDVLRKRFWLTRTGKLLIQWALHGFTITEKIISGKFWFKALAASIFDVETFSWGYWTLDWSQ